MSEGRERIHKDWRMVPSPDWLLGLRRRPPRTRHRLVAVNADALLAAFPSPHQLSEAISVLARELLAALNGHTYFHRGFIGQVLEIVSLF